MSVNSILDLFLGEDVKSYDMNIQVDTEKFRYFIRISAKEDEFSHTLSLNLLPAENCTAIMHQLANEIEGTDFNGEPAILLTQRLDSDYPHLYYRIRNTYNYVVIQQVEHIVYKYVIMTENNTLRDYMIDRIYDTVFNFAYSDEISELVAHFG